MLQFYESVAPVSLHGGRISPEEEGQLYVRFDAKGVYVALQTQQALVETQGVHKGHFLSALTSEILPQIPGTTITQHHSVWFKPGGSDACVILRIDELVWLDIATSVVRFQLVTSYNGITYQGTGSEFDIAMDALIGVVPGDILACYTCSYASFMSYGNEDLRQGWNCFRDLGVNPSTWEQWWDHEEQFKVANQNVSAFHWCTSHQKRISAEKAPLSPDVKP